MAICRECHQKMSKFAHCRVLAVKALTCDLAFRIQEVKWLLVSASAGKHRCPGSNIHTG